MACFTDDIGPMAYMLASAVRQPVKSTWSSVCQEGILSAFRTTTKLVIPEALRQRTSFEQAGLVASVAWGVWALDRTVGLGKIASFIGKATPGWTRIKRALGPLEVVLEPENGKARTLLESRRSGSEESDFTTPRCQARVGFYRDGQFVVVGSCIRMADNILVGPDHVLGGDGDKFVYGSQSVVSLKDKERIAVATDLVAIRMTDRELSTIGVSEAKIGPIPENGCYAQIVGPVSRGTTGNLRHDSTVFGRVVYGGTTIAGYSGSAYTDGSRVLGIHQRGGQVNGGFSASYAWMLVKKALNMRDESTSEYVENLYKSGKKFKWNRTGDPDEVQLLVDGYYHTIPVASMVEAWGTDWEETANKRSTGSNRTRGYEDYESGETVVAAPPLSGESRAANLGASSVLAECPVSAPPNTHSLMEMYNKLSKTQRKNFRRLVFPSENPTPSTSGQASRAQ